jgi:hypothetical protein
MNKVTAHTHAHTLVRETAGVFYLPFAGLLAVAIKHPAGPATVRSSRHRLVFVQASAKMLPIIQSCHCTLLMQPAMFKFTKINPLALK